MPFPRIQTIDDLLPYVREKPEIRFTVHPNGCTVACYMFADRDTFDSAEARECRGIAFGPDGQIVSRPLHKFFNVNEREETRLETVVLQGEPAAIFEKLDGSMIATAWVNGQVAWRSKSSFDSDVARLARQLLGQQDGSRIVDFATALASQGHTCIFELTHPEARIVVDPVEPQLRLLHVRENVSGQYVMLDPRHGVHAMIAQHQIPVVPRFDGLTLSQAIESLADMVGREGYVAQFADGEMIKLKCPWYLRLHRAVSLLRERDIATAALNENIDDVKSLLREAGVDLGEVEKVESRLADRLREITAGADAMCKQSRAAGDDRKTFALRWKSHPYFNVAIYQYVGEPSVLKQWYANKMLKTDFGLRMLGSQAVADAMEG